MSRFILKFLRIATDIFENISVLSGKVASYFRWKWISRETGRLLAKTTEELSRGSLEDAFNSPAYDFRGIYGILKDGT